MRQNTIAVSISTDGTRTVAEVAYYNRLAGEGALVTNGVGSAGRERDDKNDQTIGDDLAVARALDSLSAHLKKRANGKIRHAQSIKDHHLQISIQNAGHLITVHETGRPVRVQWPWETTARPM
jgi:hypothetical protein